MLCCARVSVDGMSRLARSPSPHGSVLRVAAPSLSIFWGDCTCGDCSRRKFCVVHIRILKTGCPFQAGQVWLCSDLGYPDVPQSGPGGTSSTEGSADLRDLGWLAWPFCGPLVTFRCGWSAIPAEVDIARQRTHGSIVALVRSLHHCR